MTDDGCLKAAEALTDLPGLTNDIFGPYVGDCGFDPAGFAKNQRLLPWCATGPGRWSAEATVERLMVEVNSKG